MSRAKQQPKPLPFTLAAVYRSGKRRVVDHWTAKSARLDAKRLAGGHDIVSIMLTDNAARETVNLFGEA